jgi:RND family efflux transporter MFP subunit
MVLPSQGLAAEGEGYDCLIEPNMVVDVSSSVEGVIERVLVDRSDSVKEGQLLVELEAGVEIAAVNKARARTQMQGDLESRKSSLEFAERRLERIHKLFKKGLVSSNDLDEVETRARLARAELNKAQDEQKLAELELKRAEEAIKLRRIRSPFTGVVMDRYKSPGESVEDKPILRLAQLDPLRVELYLPATDFGRIKPGRYAKVFPETNATDATEHYLAEVKLVDRVIDAASGTFSVRLEIPNPKHEIPGGLRCTLSFVSKAESAAIRERRSRLESEQSEKASTTETPAEDSALESDYNQMDAERETQSSDFNAMDYDRQPWASDYNAMDYERESQAAVASTYEPQPDAPLACWRVGPLADESLIESISNSLEQEVERVTRREAPRLGQNRKQYWLYLQGNSERTNSVALNRILAEYHPQLRAVPRDCPKRKAGEYHAAYWASDRR